MSDQIRAKVSALLIEWNVQFFVSLRGETDRDGWKCDEWKTGFRNGAVQKTFSYFTGTGHRKLSAMDARALQGLNPRCIAAERIRAQAKPQAPHAADVLHALCIDASAEDEGFSDWCANFGYDSDSIKALRIYDACRDNARELRQVFTRAQLRELSEALRDF